MGEGVDHQLQADHVIREQGARAVVNAMWLRFGILCLSLPTVTYFSTSQPDWAAYVDPLIVYTAAAGALLAWQRRTPSLLLARVVWLIDVACIWFMQVQAMRVSDEATGIAGVSLGLFAILIALSGATLQFNAPVFTCFGAGVALWDLFGRTGFSRSDQIFGVMMLVSQVAIQRVVVRQLRAVFSRITRIEIERRVASDRFDALADAKAQIEALLVQEHATNERLSTLQAEKDTLTALVVHDLRAPLSAARANVEWLQKEVSPDAEVKEALDETNETLQRIVAMVGDMLNITRLEHNSLEVQANVISPMVLLRTMCRQFGAQARAKNVQLQISSKTQEDDFIADQLLTTRVLENLISNAIRYTPMHGRVELAYATTDDTVRLIVRNDGKPISESQRAVIFEKFAQGGSATENRRAGWGLGLYFCKLVARAHGGDISFEDAPGWPTSFVVTLRRHTSRLRAA